jgi:hypothetical protein
MPFNPNLYAYAVGRESVHPSFDKRYDLRPFIKQRGGKITLKTEGSFKRGKVTMEYGGSRGLTEVGGVHWWNYNGVFGICENTTRNLCHIPFPFIEVLEDGREVPLYVDNLYDD